MRENRPYGSEGGGAGKPALPTPIKVDDIGLAPCGPAIAAPSRRHGSRCQDIRVPGTQYLP